MPRFMILIDDGELITPDGDTSYRNMDAAVEATVRAALSKAGERAIWSHVDQALRCEVQERGTSERREFDVLLRIEEQRLTARPGHKA